ncbi:MAG: hypothetical protein ACK4QP_11140 [Pseudorhizobium sp.]
MLDISLPDIDGFDLLTKVRANSTVPAIFLSAQLLLLCCRAGMFHEFARPSIRRHPVPISLSAPPAFATLQSLPAPSRSSRDRGQ